jgi:hypothetical protein
MPGSRFYDPYNPLTPQERLEYVKAHPELFEKVK